MCSFREQSHRPFRECTCPEFVTTQSSFVALLTPGVHARNACKFGRRSETLTSAKQGVTESRGTRTVCEHVEMTWTHILTVSGMCRPVRYTLSSAALTPTGFQGFQD